MKRLRRHKIILKRVNIVVWQNNWIAYQKVLLIQMLKVSLLKFKNI